MAFCDLPAGVTPYAELGERELPHHCTSQSVVDLGAVSSKPQHSAEFMAMALGTDARKAPAHRDGHTANRRRDKVPCALDCRARP